MTDTPPGPATPPPADAGQRWLLPLVLAGALLLAGALAGGIAWRRGAFAPEAEVYAVIDNAAGLAPGTAVRMSGVRVGEVRALELQPDLTVRMRLRIDADLMPRLRSDAGGVLIREQLRPAVIELEPGGAPGPLDPRHPQIAFRGRASLTEIADELRGRLVPVLDDLKQVTGMLRQRQGDVAAVLGNAASASGELAGAAAEMRTLLAQARSQLGGLGGQSQALLVQGNGAVAKVGTLIDQVSASLGVVNGALPSLIHRADDTLAQLNAVARDTRQISAAAAATLPGLLQAAPPVVDDAQDLLQGVRRSWPVRGLLPPPPAAELPLESHDAAVLRHAAPR